MIGSLPYLGRRRHAPAGTLAVSFSAKALATHPPSGLCGYRRPAGIHREEMMGLINRDGQWYLYGF